MSCPYCLIHYSDAGSERTVMLQYKPLGEPSSIPWGRMLGCFGSIALFILALFFIGRVRWFIAFPLLVIWPFIIYRMWRKGHEDPRPPINFERPPLPVKDEPDEEPRAPLR